MSERWIYVKVHPNARKDILVSMTPDRFEAWVRAKPIAGFANDAVTNLLARTLQIPQDCLRLVKGRSSHRKIFKILS